MPTYIKIELAIIYLTINEPVPCVLGRGCMHFINHCNNSILVGASISFKNVIEIMQPTFNQSINMLMHYFFAVPFQTIQRASILYHASLLLEE